MSKVRRAAAAVHSWPTPPTGGTAVIWSTSGWALEDVDGARVADADYVGETYLGALDLAGAGLAA